LTKIPFVKPAMEKGLRVIVNGQQPGGGYNYRYAQTERWDLSVASWQLQAMKAGYVAGADVPGLEEAMLKGIDWLKNTNYNNNKFGYSAPGKGSPGMQGAGTLCLQLLGEGDSDEARSCVENTLANYRPQWKNMGHGGSCYAWYYMTQAIFHAGKSYFKNWNAEFAPMLIKHQFEDGHWGDPGHAGHGGNNDNADADADDEEHGGEAVSKDPQSYHPYMSTAMNALSLQVYYRYLPTYQEPTKIAQQQEDIFEFDEEEF
jgi:hypothetical protein